MLYRKKVYINLVLVKLFALLVCAAFCMLGHIIIEECQGGDTCYAVSVFFPSIVTALMHIYLTPLQFIFNHSCFIQWVVLLFL